MHESVLCGEHWECDDDREQQPLRREHGQEGHRREPEHHLRERRAAEELPDQRGHAVERMRDGVHRAGAEIREALQPPTVDAEAERDLSADHLPEHRPGRDRSPSCPPPVAVVEEADRGDPGDRQAEVVAEQKEGERAERRCADPPAHRRCDPDDEDGNRHRRRVAGEPDRVPHERVHDECDLERGLQATFDAQRREHRGQREDRQTEGEGLDEEHPGDGRVHSVERAEHEVHGRKVIAERVPVEARDHGHLAVARASTRPGRSRGCRRTPCASRSTGTMPVRS